VSIKKIIVKGTKDFTNFYNSLQPTSLHKKQIDESMDFMKADKTIGEKIEKKLWPKHYLRQHSISNLFRYRIPDGYRILYTITTTNYEKIYLILDCLPHNEYDKLFGYKKG
jgi:mRNA-degrading endonuclease RelE of RelBE toxin-antitoxin system